MRKLLEQIYGKKLEEFNDVKYSLPLYLQDGRKFYRVSLSGHSFVVVRFVNAERFNMKALKKQLVIYQNAVNSYVVYGFERISTFQRKSLIENDVPFIACNGQMYLPFMGTYFEKCAKKEEVLKEQFMPAAQLLFLLFLYENNSYTKSGAAKRLKVQPMAISRASKELLDKGLIKEEKKGTEIFMTICDADRKAFYGNGKRHLINPVQSVIYLPNGRVDQKILEAGEFGLSLRSELGYPEYAEYAVYKDAPGVKEWGGENPDLVESGEYVRIQKWKYDPFLFSDDEKVDPVSLICSFRETEDERIHKCLVHVEEEIWKWQITQN